MPENKLTEEQAERATRLKPGEKMALPDGRHVCMTLDEGHDCFLCDVCALNRTKVCADFNCQQMIPLIVDPNAPAGSAVPCRTEEENSVRERSPEPTTETEGKSL